MGDQNRNNLPKINPNNIPIKLTPGKYNISTGNKSEDFINDSIFRECKPQKQEFNNAMIKVDPVSKDNNESFISSSLNSLIYERAKGR